MADKLDGPSRVAGVALIVVLIGLAWNFKPSSLTFQKDALNNLGSMFGYLLLVSLFVERAIEVFLSAWRSGEADARDIQITQARNRLEKNIVPSENGHAAALSGTAVTSELGVALEALEHERVLYKARSRFIAQWFGLGIGTLVALAGVRVLNGIVDVTGLSGAQTTFFVIVDVLLTGAVLAGGSDALNRITKLYSSFMSTTAQRTQAAPTPHPTQAPTPVAATVTVPASPPAGVVTPPGDGAR